ncbi:MAG: DedA family protein [Actinomycetota bacterium]|nr:DedA family protein [Actinomycetota bacterium]
MDGLSGWVLETIRALGYLGLAFLLALENLFPPIPSEVVLPLAGFLVGRGQLNFWGAVGAATFGSVFGALVLYALGRWGGRRIILRYGRFLNVNAESLKRAEGWFRHYGDAVVLIARVIPLARSIVSIPAGTAHMPILRFTVLTTIGTTVWNIILIWAGRLLGQNWDAVSQWVGSYSSVVYVAVAIIVVAYVALKVVRHKNRNEAG